VAAIVVALTVLQPEDAAEAAPAGAEAACAEAA
jgi:hypothetical protein